MLTVSLFGNDELTLSLGSTTLILITGVLFILWAIFTFIARYHWKKYGTSKIDVLQMTTIFFSGSALIFACMIVCIMLYNLSAPV